MYLSTINVFHVPSVFNATISYYHLKPLVLNLTNAMLFPLTHYYTLYNHPRPIMVPPWPLEPHEPECYFCIPPRSTSSSSQPLSASSVHFSDYGVQSLS